MKAIFNFCKNRINTVEDIAWIDLDKGQISDYEVRPPIGFPACLIGISYPQTSNHQRKLQKCNVQITVRTVFDFTGNTDSTMPDQALVASLKYFDVVKAVHDSLQGEIDPGVFNAPLERVSQREHNLADGLKVMDITYQTWAYDQS